MDLKVCVPSVEYMVESVCRFQTEETSDFFQASLYRFYSQFDRERMSSFCKEEREAYIRTGLEQVYEQNRLLLEEKGAAYQEAWNENRAAIQDAFGDLFSVEPDRVLNDMTANVTLNPVCPRYLETHSFDLFYLNSPGGALGISLHEIVHFLWFRAWQEKFHDDRSEYENPHLKWVFSELVVDLFLNDPRLRPLNPYLTKGNGTIYDYFHTMTVGGKPVLPRMEAVYRANGLDGLMEEGYSLFRQHEAEVRAAMR